MSDAQNFAHAGRLLFGPHWINAMTDLTGLNQRTVQRAAKAAREGADYWIAPAIMDQLAGELFKLSDEAGDLGEEIDKGCLEVGEQREAEEADA